MGVSVRSYLTAGAAAATATVVALGPLQTTPPDIAVPAQPGATQPHLSQALIDLLASAGQMHAALPAPPQPHGTPALSGATPAAAVTADLGDVSVQNAASDFVTSTYQYIQGWVDWGVNYGVDIAYWLSGWGVPFAGLAGDQANILYYQLIRPIADSVVYNLINPVLNAPLNLGVWADGIRSVAYSVVANAINTGVAEINYFLGWVLPPLPPPFPVSLTAATSPLTTTSLANALTDATANLTDVVEKLSTTPVASLLNLATETTTETADTTEATDTEVTDSSATGDADDTNDATNPLAAVRADVHHAFEDVSQFVKAQLGQITEIPGSVRQSLTEPAVTADTTIVDTKTAETKTAETKTADTKPRATRTPTDRATRVKADVKKATDGVRSAVRDVRKALSGKKPAAATGTTATGTKSASTSADTTKAGKKDKRAEHASAKAADNHAAE